MNLGCQMNLSDSERIQTVIERMGYQRTEKEDEADLLELSPVL
jgi:tRNA-2-methylthio-N6-dimethylallyladenosine synthase